MALQGACLLHAAEIRNAPFCVNPYWIRRVQREPVTSISASRRDAMSNVEAPARFGCTRACGRAPSTIDDVGRGRHTTVARNRAGGSATVARLYPFPILTGPQTAAMRTEARQAYAEGKFEQSYSEVNGVRVAKPGVHSSELDGDEWAACPSSLCYTREVLLTLSGLLSLEFPSLLLRARLRYETRRHSLGSSRSLHVDNVGLPDTRKLDSNCLS